MNISSLSFDPATPTMRMTASLYARHTNANLAINPVDWAGDLDTIHDLKKALLQAVDVGDFAKAMHILQALQNLH